MESKRYNNQYEVKVTQSLMVINNKRNINCINTTALSYYFIRIRT